MRYEKRGCRIGLILGLAGALLAGGVSGCAPNGSEEPQGDRGKAAAANETAAVEFTWSADADCSTCHGAESSSITDESTVAGIHGAEGDTCATCHIDGVDLAAVHEGATTDSKMPKKLKKTKIDEAVCLACHGSGEELAEKTAASLALTDSEGTTVNPHALPSGSDHDMVTCSDCHSMHGSDPVADTAKAECLSCHHQDVFECGTCHDV